MQGVKTGGCLLEIGSLSVVVVINSGRCDAARYRCSALAGRSGGVRTSVARQYALTGKYPDGYFRGVATSFGVLADPTRRRILALLIDGPRSVGELVAELKLSQPATSKQLRVLREAGFVKVHVDAQRRLYELCLAPLQEVDEWLTDYRRLWDERLDALGKHLDRQAGE